MFYWIWLGKLLANELQFAKFSQDQNSVLYGM